MKPRHLPAFIYLALSVVAFIFCAREGGHLGLASEFSLALTFPWSLSMILFSWGIIHDGARSVLIFLVPFALVNFFIMLKLPGWMKRWPEPGR
jgi:hypothetical protein